MSYDIFPDLPSMEWKIKKSQHWNTVVQKSGSGRRKTLSLLSYPDWGIALKYLCLNQHEIEQLVGFFAMMRGRHQPFLWLDPDDFEQTGVKIGIGDGVTTGFQLLRDLAGYAVDPVLDIVPGTLTVYVDGAATPVDLEDDGWIELTAPPDPGSEITADFQYYWRVAFDDDDMEWTTIIDRYYETGRFKLVTVK